MKKLLITTRNAEFQIIESLKTNRIKRARNGEIFIEGIESIKQILKSGLEITRIITTEKISPWAMKVIGQFEDSQGHRPGERAVPKIIKMDTTLYRELCDRNDPSEMLITACMPKISLNDVKPPEHPFILVLDRPSDTGNLGSIIRSANSFGIDAVLLLGHGVDPWDPKTIRASLGSIFFTVPIQLESLQELVQYIQLLKNQYKIEVLGTDSNGTSSLVSRVIKRPIMLILGNEAKGMSLALKELCGEIISIPMSGAVNSLNIASAASIFIWEVTKRSSKI